MILTRRKKTSSYTQSYFHGCIIYYVPYQIPIKFAVSFVMAKLYLYPSNSRGGKSYFVQKTNTRTHSGGGDIPTCGSL